MKSFNKPFALGAVLLGLTFGAGCGTVVEGDGGAVGVDVYGADEGPWDYGTVEYGGVGHVRPPFHAEDDHRGGDDHGRPVAAPARSAPARSAPSIPNHARPSGGGGGGGRPSGGGGGHPSSSGDHKH